MQGKTTLYDVHCVEQYYSSLQSVEECKSKLTQCKTNPTLYRGAQHGFIHPAKEADDSGENGVEV